MGLFLSVAVAVTVCSLVLSVTYKLQRLHRLIPDFVRDIYILGWKWTLQAQREKGNKGRKEQVKDKRFPLHCFIVFVLVCWPFSRQKKKKSQDSSCCLEKSQSSQMSANKEAEVQMDLVLMGFILIHRMRDKALTGVVFTLINSFREN